MARYDVVTMGETMLRLTPPGPRRLVQATSFEVEVGGTESNAAIGLARLGLNSVWLSRLTDNPMGHIIANTIAAHGVDTSRIVWTPEDRVGMLYLERGTAPRGSRVYYDRQHSAVSRMRPEDLPESLFQPEMARLFHTTGISLALGESLTATVHRAVQLAKTAGWRFSFDFNYRRLLWEPVAAKEMCDAMAKQADIVFIPRGDACTLYDLDPNLPPDQMLTILTDCFPHATIALTLGADGAMGVEPGGDIKHQAAFRAEEVERLGGGDAFAAGFLYVYLTMPDTVSRLPSALRWGAAVAALKYTIPGDAPLVEKSEVEALLQQGNPSSSVFR